MLADDIRAFMLKYFKDIDAAVRPSFIRDANALAALVDAAPPTPTAPPTGQAATGRTARQVGSTYLGFTGYDDFEDRDHRGF